MDLVSAVLLVVCLLGFIVSAGAVGVFEPTVETPGNPSETGGGDGDTTAGGTGGGGGTGSGSGNGSSGSGSGGAGEGSDETSGPSGGDDEDNGSAGGSRTGGNGNASTGEGGNESTGGSGNASTGEGGNESTGGNGNASTGEGGNESTGGNGNASTGEGGNESTGGSGNASTDRDGNGSASGDGNESDSEDDSRSDSSTGGSTDNESAGVSVSENGVGEAGNVSPSGTQRGVIGGGDLSAASETKVSGQLDSLSTAVLFEVEAASARYWRTQAYSTYTGRGWERDGESRALKPPAVERPVESRSLTQRITVRKPSGVVPSAWAPQDVTGVDGRVEVGSEGGLVLSEPLATGETVTVQSAVRSPDPAVLADAGRDYPAAIEERYTALPSSVSGEFERRTAAIVDDAGAETPYETAVAVERHLERTKGYSLGVTRPDGDIAEAFLLEMDRGYCQYFATTMVVMLRSEGIPARYVTGYTPGQPVGDSYVVRGLNAHAWVEVYFPDQGWVRFDPTPAGPRVGLEQAAVEESRGAGLEGVDTGQSARQSAEFPSDDGLAAPPSDGRSRAGENGGQSDDDTGGDRRRSDTGDRSDDGGQTGDGDRGDDGSQGGDMGGGNGDGERGGDGGKQDDGSQGDDGGDRDDGDGQDESTSDGGDGKSDERDRPPIELSVEDEPVPGDDLTVQVTRGDSPVEGATVLFNGDPVGSTDANGTVTARVPYAEQLTVTVRPPSGTTRGESAARKPGPGTPERRDGPSVRAVVGTGPVSHAATVVQQGNETDGGDGEQSFDLETEVSTSLTGTTPGETVVVSASIRDVPVRNGTVVIDGETVGRTNDSGALRVTLPYRETVTVEIERDAADGNRTVSLASEGTVALDDRTPGTESTLTATLGERAVPFPGATVAVDGDRVGTTGNSGQATLQVPYRRNATVSVSRGEVTVERTVSAAGSLSLSVEGRTLPTRPVDLQATVDGEPVPNATVLVDGKAVATTGADGRATVRLPVTNSARIAVERGDFSDAVLADWLLVPLLVPLVALAGVVGGGVYARRRFGGVGSWIGSRLGALVRWALGLLVAVAVVLSGRLDEAARLLRRAGAALRRLAAGVAGRLRAAAALLRQAGAAVVGFVRRLSEAPSPREALDMLIGATVAWLRRLPATVRSLVTPDERPGDGGDGRDRAGPETGGTGVAGEGDGDEAFDVVTAWQRLRRRAGVSRRWRRRRTPGQVARRVERNRPTGPVRTLLRAYRRRLYGPTDDLDEEWRERARSAYREIRAHEGVGGQRDDSSVADDGDGTDGGTRATDE